MNVLIFIPTYNEADNILILLDKIFKIDDKFRVLLVDDNSPDGTAEIVRNTYREDRVKVVVRTEKRGRGYVGIYGFRKALEIGFDKLIEMDGDLSHSPEFLPALLGESEKYDIVIGSRFVKGGKDKERGFLREFISFFAREYISLTLGLKVKDITSGFRVFNPEVIEKVLPHLTVNDPFIVAEFLYWANRYGFSIKEVPIYFYNRQKGNSKLNAKILITYLFKVVKLAVKGRKVKISF